MKKRISNYVRNHFKYFFSACILLGLLCLFTEYAYFKSTVPVMKNLTSTYGYSVIQYGESKYQDDLVRYADIAFERIPEKLVNQFYADKGVLSFDSNDEYISYDWSAGYMGFMDNGNVKISVRSDIQTDNGTPFVICHEFGHYFDHVMDNPSQSKDWEDITNEEYPKMIRNNKYYSDPKEYFAQSFAWYCYRNDILGEVNKKACPKTFEYIDNLVEFYNQ